MTASAATLVAIGSVAWYYHLYGREAFAMTPQEEGSALFLSNVRPIG